MAFQIFTPLFNKIDIATASFITDISSRSIAAVTPVVSVGLTLSFITYGILIIRGVIDLPIMEFLGRAIRISIITGIALTGGLYQSNIADTIRSTPDELITALILNPSKETGAASKIDEAAEKGFNLASEAFEKAGFFEKNGILYCMFGVIIMLTTGILVAIGGAILLLTKLALAILTGLGPLFIIALLWQPTARFFDMWVAQLLNYILLVVLFTALFGLLISIYSLYLSDMKFDGIQNIAYALGGAVILSIAMIVVLLQLPNMAAGLAGGVSLSYLYELRSVSSGATSVATYVSNRDIVNNRVNSVSRSNIGNIAADNKQPGITKGKTSYGYFKGKSNKTT